MPKFHYFPLATSKLSTASWKDVKPGDGIIAPGTIAWRLDDFKDRYNDRVHVFKTKHRIMLVIGVIESVEDEPGSEGFGTFLVWTRHGLLCIIAPRK